MQSVIEYQAVVPGQRHFQCSPLRALLSTQACADRFSRTLQPDSEKFITCKRCPIGRQHHEEHNPSESVAPLRPVRAPVCIRCGRPASRMVESVLCPSCWNRAAEAKRGYNARGNPLRNYIVPSPRRVGVVGQDGTPAWVLFDGQHFPESMALAARTGLRLNDAQPGRSVWNPCRQAFEYRNSNSHLLIEMKIEGRIEYVGVERLHPGEAPAQVTIPTLLMDPEAAETWLTVSGDSDSLTCDWHQLEFACSRCGHGMLHGYKGTDGIHVRCSAGCC